MNKKQKLGQFFTTNSEYIIGNLVDIIQDNSKVIDPFAGDWDLLKCVDKPTIELCGFDIEPRNEKTVKQDTLKYPPSYTGCWIVTNPPYLGKNKCENKEIFEQYKTDDLYKAALLSIIGSEGGIIVVPLNFLSTKRSKVRNIFLKEYEIEKINIFEEQVFNDTTYTVCAFSFIRKENKKQKISATFYPSGEKRSFILKSSDDYRIGADFFSLLDNKSSVKVSRLMKGQEPNSKLFLRALDSGSKDGRISLQLREESYYGISTDRAFASINFSKKFSLEQQTKIMEDFNFILEENRRKYNSLFLPSFRNSTSHCSRKRIAFADAYDLIKHVIKKNGF